MLFVTFTGLDGSGKSTQLKILEDKLEKEQKPFFSFHIIEFSLANRLVKKVRKGKTPQAKTKASRLSLFLRKIFLFIDLVRFRFFFQKIKKQKIEFLLADRYFFDQIVNILYLDQKAVSAEKPFWQKMAEKMLILPNLGFYLSINPEIIQLQNRTVEQGSSYLEKKRVILDKLAPDWNLKIISAQESKQAIANSIWQKIEKLTP